MFNSPPAVLRPRRGAPSRIPFPRNERSFPPSSLTNWPVLMRRMGYSGSHCRTAHRPLAADCQPSPREVPVLEAIPPPGFGKVADVDRSHVYEEPGPHVPWPTPFLDVDELVAVEVHVEDGSDDLLGRLHRHFSQLVLQSIKDVGLIQCEVFLPNLSSGLRIDQPCSPPPPPACRGSCPPKAA